MFTQSARARVFQAEGSAVGLLSSSTRVMTTSSITSMSWSRISWP